MGLMLILDWCRFKEYLHWNLRQFFAPKHHLVFCLIFPIYVFMGGTNNLYKKHIISNHGSFFPQILFCDLAKTQKFTIDFIEHETFYNEYNECNKERFRCQSNLFVLFKTDLDLTRHDLHICTYMLSFLQIPY